MSQLYAIHDQDLLNSATGVVQVSSIGDILELLKVLLLLVVPKTLAQYNNDQRLH